MLVWNRSFSSSFNLIFHGKSSTFMAWTVFCPQWHQWETSQSWTSMKVLKVQLCFGISSDPWEPGLLCRVVLCLDTDLPFTMVTSAWLRKEWIPMAATFPAPLALDKIANSEHTSAAGGRRSKCFPAGHKATHSSPLLSMEPWASTPPWLMEWETFLWN